MAQIVNGMYFGKWFEPRGISCLSSVIVRFSYLKSSEESSSDDGIFGCGLA